MFCIYTIMIMKIKAAYMYGPGRPFRALKHKQVSSTKTGPFTWEESIILLRPLVPRGDRWGRYSLERRYLVQSGLTLFSDYLIWFSLDLWYWIGMKDKSVTKCSHTLTTIGHASAMHTHSHTHTHTHSHTHTHTHSHTHSNMQTLRQT